MGGGGGGTASSALQLDVGVKRSSEVFSVRYDGASRTGCASGSRPPAQNASKGTATLRITACSLFRNIPLRHLNTKSILLEEQ